jgi:hypothetical protein
MPQSIKRPAPSASLTQQPFLPGLQHTRHAFLHTHCSRMRKTLRRSCDACARSKLSCDLRTPHCSRCLKRKTTCFYANQPLNGSFIEATSPKRTLSETEAVNGGYGVGSVVLSNSIGSRTLDPFDSYPPTRLPRAHVQRLIQHCESPTATFTNGS